MRSAKCGRPAIRSFLRVLSFPVCGTGAFAFTPKEFRHIAQGCSRSEQPWVEYQHGCTPKGFRHEMPVMTQPFQGRAGMH